MKKLGPVQIAAAVANEAISKARLLEATGSQESRFRVYGLGRVLWVDAKAQTGLKASMIEFRA